MYLDIIFISKVDTIDKNKLVKDFRGKVNFIGNQLKCGKLNFNYESKKSINDSIIRLKVNTKKGTSTYNEAKDLSYLKDQIRRGEHRKDYNIIIAYDGSSEYYCNRLSPLISRFERKLRQCIYLIMLARYGNEWVKETISEDIMKEVSEKGGNKSKFVEIILEYFDFKNYIEYLFTKREEYNAVKAIEEAKFEMNKSESEKKDVLSILNKYKTISLWEKLFNTYDEMEFLETDIENIRKIRNDVLHNKEVSDSEFINQKKLLMESNKKLNRAIKRIEDEKYNDTVNVVDVLYSLGEVMKSIASTSEALMKTITPAMEQFIEISKSITSFIQQRQIYNNISLAIENRLPDLPIIDYKNNFSSSIEFQKSLSGIIPESNLKMEQLKQAATTSIPKNLIQPLKLAQESAKFSYPENIMTLSETINKQNIFSIGSIDIDDTDKSDLDDEIN